MKIRLNDEQIPRELTLADLDSVSGGCRKAGGDPKLSGKEFLTFRFETVFTTK